MTQFPALMQHSHTLELVTVTSPAEVDDFTRRGYVPGWHRRHPLGWDYCDAGWRSFYGGRWPKVPCDQPSRHVIGSDMEVPAPVLCDRHYVEIAHLVTDKNIGEDDFRRRYGGKDRPV